MDDQKPTYANLMDWYRKNPNTGWHLGLEMHFVKRTCDLLVDDRGLLAPPFFRLLEEYLGYCGDVTDALFELENVFARFHVDFFQLISRSAENSLNLGPCIEAEQYLVELADRCELPVIRFLGAWVAFNNGHAAIAIEHCESIDPPMACVHTLLGQAYMDLQDYPKAIKNFQVAIDLAPGEILAHFQLAKIFCATGDYEKSWSQLESCEVYAPNNLEIDAMFAVVALSQDKSQPEKIRSCLDRLNRHMNSVEVSTDLVVLAHRLIFATDDASLLESLYERIAWDTLKKDPQFFHSVPTLLRGFEQHEWVAESTALLQRIA